MESEASGVDDLTLLQLYAQHRDAEAMQVLVRRHQHQVFAVCLRYLRSEADALDATQEVFLALMNCADDVHSNLPAWLYRCARNTSTSIVRLRQVRYRHEAAKSRLCPEGRADNSRKEHCEILDACLLRLDSIDRDLVIRNHLMGSSQKELATWLGVSQQAVAKRIQKALAELRRTLSSQGIVFSAFLALLLLFRRAAASTTKLVSSLVSAVPTASSGPGTAVAIKVVGTAGVLLVAAAVYENAGPLPSHSGASATAGTAAPASALSPPITGARAAGPAPNALAQVTPSWPMQMAPPLASAPDIAARSDRPLTEPSASPVAARYPREAAMVQQDPAASMPPVGKVMERSPAGSWFEPTFVARDPTEAPRATPESFRHAQPDASAALPQGPPHAPGAMPQGSLLGRDSDAGRFTPGPTPDDRLQALADEIRSMRVPDASSVAAGSEFRPDQHAWPALDPAAEFALHTPPDFSPLDFAPPDRLAMTMLPPFAPSDPAIFDPPGAASLPIPISAVNLSGRSWT